MISIIPQDQTIVIDGVSATDHSGDRVSAVVAPNVNAIQYDPERGIGEIEYMNDPFWRQNGGEFRRNEPVTEEDIGVTIAAIRELHATLIAEAE